ncbi:MAG TPA: PIN domain-containing protein [Geminicoccus sp.]|jgi:PIN domain nuclease of toxin-antitoxin system|uniref:PIN domain-containing protein n=1 Tax=Geminicoccus sp. TaxID=2024832 RepID=UPI002E37593F|nr:PIN domain-containing protein [Geminicoccus sp.]HEX2527830.1 PIN domain-containing protein [Geminicoccus sp.]
MPILDSSALLALLFDEPGAQVTMDALHEPGTTISAVNLAEVVGVMVRKGGSTTLVHRSLDALSIPVVPFDGSLAFDVGVLEASTREQGMSLGDRTCLALAVACGRPLVTADRALARQAERMQVAVRMVR